MRSTRASARGGSGSTRSVAAAFGAPRGFLCPFAVAGHGNPAGDGLAMAGDGQAVVAGDPVAQLAEMGFGPAGPTASTTVQGGSPGHSIGLYGWTGTALR